MIIGEIRRYMRDNNSVRVSRSMRDMAYKSLQTKEELTNRNSREPTIEEISKQMNVAREDVVMALDAIMAPVSLYEPVYSETGDTLYVMDQVGDSVNIDENWLEEIALKEAMSGLDEREKKIMTLRFFEGKTQTEVAEEIHISQAQVSRLEKSALKSMKHYLS